jgi:hypothetical protein
MPWGERLTETSFESNSPFARGPFGFFLGEYEGLSSTGNTFWPLFAIVNDGDPANRTTSW